MKSKKIGIKIIGVLSFLLLFLVVNVIIVVGVFQPKSYQDAFQSDYYLSFEDTREQLVAFGLLAPSSHNLQPWKVVLSEENENEMLLYIDSLRTLPVVDEDFTQMFFSAGVFLTYMNEGAKQLGVDLTIEYFPYGELDFTATTADLDVTPIAMITYLESDTETSLIMDAVSGATERMVYESGIETEVLSEIIGLNQDDSILINFVTEQTEVERLIEMLIEGVEIESKHEAAMLETGNVLRITNHQKSEFKYGLSMDSNNPSVVMRTIIQYMAKIMAQGWEKDGEFWLNGETKNIESSETFGFIQTANNTRLDQVKAGELYGMIQLYAYHNGLEMQPFYQTLEKYDEMSEVNQEVVQAFQVDSNTIQIIFRMGTNSTQVSQGMRLHVEDIIKE